MASLPGNCGIEARPALAVRWSCWKAHRYSRGDLRYQGISAAKERPCIVRSVIIPIRG